MAIFTRTNGDAAPVFAIDIQNGPANLSLALLGSGNTVQPAGPKLDFFQANIVGAAAAGAQGVNGVVSNALQAIQQLGTVAFYQVDSGNLVSFAVYPTGAFTAAAGVGTATSTPANINSVLSTAVTLGATNATNTGFKLAAS